MSIWDEYCTYRNALRALVDTIDDGAAEYGDRMLLFLTYQLDMQLFEEQVLAWLMNEDSAGPLRVKSRRISLDRWLKDVRTTVLYDANGLVNPVKRTGVTAAPVSMKHGGVFHPKVVLYANGLDVGMLIGSANLTRSGLGNNLECLYLLSRDSNTWESLVRGPYLRGEIKEMLSEIQGYIPGNEKPAKNSLQKWSRVLGSHFTDRAARGWSDIKLIWNSDKKRGSSNEDLFRLLGKSSELYGWAPYFPMEFSEEDSLPRVLEEFLESTNRIPGDSLWLCPAPGRRDPNRRHLGKDFFNSVKEFFEERVWKEYKPFKRQVRFAHAKLMRIVSEYEHLVLGSHNLTSAAWGTRKGNPSNYEASLLIKCDGRRKSLGRRPKSENFVDLDDNFEADAENDDENSKPPMPEITVIADWEACRAEIHFPPTENGEARWFLETPWKFKGHERREIHPRKERPTQEKNLDLTPLLQSANFRLDRVLDQDKTSWKGLITEKNPEIRPAGYVDLKGFLNSLLTGDEAPPDDDEGGNGKGSRGSGKKRGQGKKKEESRTNNVFDIWFDLFSVFRRLAEISRHDPGKALEAATLFEREVRNSGDMRDADPALLVRRWIVAVELGRILEGKAKIGMGTAVSRHSSLEEALRREVCCRLEDDGDLYLRWTDLVGVEAVTLEKKMKAKYRKELAMDEE